MSGSTQGSPYSLGFCPELFKHIHDCFCTKLHLRPWDRYCGLYTALKQKGNFPAAVSDAGAFLSFCFTHGTLLKATFFHLLPFPLKQHLLFHLTLFKFEVFFLFLCLVLILLLGMCLRLNKCFMPFVQGIHITLNTQVAFRDFDSLFALEVQGQMLY